MLVFLLKMGRRGVVFFLICIGELSFRRVGDVFELLGEVGFLFVSGFGTEF